jgi:8-oxo-dGTP pyrophosphatase MutT (NUDIX family)
VTEPLPEWLRTLAAKAAELDGSDLSRFLPPDDGSGRASAVLMAFADGPAGPSVLLIERAADLRKHAGQVAFPGGSLDPSDASLDAAALREAEEEVGLDPATVRIVASLPAIFIPVSGFVVTPVLAYWERPHEVRAVDPAEVARVELVPIAALADPANRFRVTHPSGWVGPAFEVAGLFVWGFTAGLLDRMLEFGGWARPWDETRLRPLPNRLDPAVRRTAEGTVRDANTP